MSEKLDVRRCQAQHFMPRHLYTREQAEEIGREEVRRKLVGAGMAANFIPAVTVREDGDVWVVEGEFRTLDLPPEWNR